MAVFIQSLYGLRVFCPPIAPISYRSHRSQDTFLLLYEFLRAVLVELGFSTSSFLCQDCIQSMRVDVVKSLLSFSAAVKGDGELLVVLVGVLFWFLLLELFCFL